MEQKSLAKSQNNMPATDSVMGNIGMSREVAEIQASVFMARQFPRDEERALTRIIKSCQNFNFARQAVYQYAKGGTNIEGPSIRAAEMLAREMGNIVSGIREIEQSNGESVVQAFAWDLETNVRSEMIFKVSHVRHTRNGDYTVTDPREIYEMVANNGARRKRACILSLIPPDVVDTALEECSQTVIRYTQVDEETTAKLLEAFKKYGVSQKMIENRIQRNYDAIDAYQVNDLRKVYTSLKDGIGQVDDFFDTSVAESQKPIGEGNKPKKKTSQKKKDEKEAPPEESEKDSESSEELFEGGGLD